MNKLIILYILLNIQIIQKYIVKIVLAQNCGSEFSGKCFCGNAEYEDNIKFMVNCTNTNFKNTNVLKYMPSNTQVLLFTGNNIPELPWNVFGTINDYPNLTIIDMSNNNIKEIRGKSYHHVQHVERLILNHNNLSISSYDEHNDDEVNHHHPRVFSNFLNLMELHLTNAFADNTSDQLSEDLHDIFVNSNLTKITKLHLEQNEILKFRDRNVFCDLPNLKDLHLGDNLLKELNFNILCLPNLRFLDLQRNKFQFVKSKDLKLMNDLEMLRERTINLVVDFNLNPFQCFDCQINNFVNWIKTTNVTVRNKEFIQCSKSYSNSRSRDNLEYLLELNLSNNKCNLMSQEVKTSLGHKISLIFLLTILVTFLLALIIALIYKSKDRLRAFIVQPVMNNVSRKVYYTTIKDEDCKEVHV